MGILVFLLTLICYGLAIYLWWDQQMPIFVFALLSGHISALASPLWSVVYDIAYWPDLAVLVSIAGHPLQTVVFLGAAWAATLPALLALYLYYAQWWSPGYMTGLIASGGFLLYHTIVESLGLRLGIWRYTNAIPLPFGLSDAFVSALMAALVSLLVLYVLLLVRRFSWISSLLIVLPTTLLASLLIRGLLGAPLWVALAMDAQDWMITIGTLSTLLLLAWAVHIISRALGRVEWELA